MSRRGPYRELGRPEQGDVTTRGADLRASYVSLVGFWPATQGARPENQVTVTFPAVPGAIGYRLYRGTRYGFIELPRRRRMGKLTKRNKAKRRRAALKEGR